MRSLKKRNIELRSYMISIGSVSEKTQPKFDSDEEKASDDELLEDEENLTEAVPPSVNSVAGVDL